MRKAILSILILLAGLVLVPRTASAQFKSEAFSQNYGTSDADTAQKPLFSVKDYIRGIAHKDTIQIGTSFAGSMILVGGQQIYNRQYWKLPIVYGGLGATVGLGFYYRNQYTQSLSAYNAALELDSGTPYTVNDRAKELSTYLFIGGGLVYWGTLMDGVINFKSDRYPLPGRATLYSLLFPGLGQVYNHEYWKIPIYWGFLIGSYHYWDVNKRNYLKYKNIYLAATSGEAYDGPFGAETALYYRDIFRRYRDYSVLAMAAFYLIQVIDANVFAYMHDFEVNEDISLHIRPSVITPDLQFASRPVNAVGVSLGITF
ncbi:MAG: hypothetical protein IJ654_04970 [Bacteroidales bacterium]|nr:hypothetical protein [Bacteroidales bacterium]